MKTLNKCLPNESFKARKMHLKVSVVVLRIFIRKILYINQRENITISI